MSTLFRGGWVLAADGTTGAPLDVLVEGGRITEVGAGLVGRGAEVVDVTGCTVMPGMIDAHVHLAMSGSREPDGSDQQRRERVAANARLLLESEGLLRLYPKRGALVVPVSAAEVTDVMETRELVECFAIERAARIGGELKDALDASLATQQKLIDQGDYAAFVDADREFHRMFIDAGGNAILLQLYDSLRDRQARMGLAAVARSGASLRLDEHRALVDAVVAGHGGLAVELLKKHLGGTLSLLREQPAR